MITINVEIVKDTATPALRALRDGLRNENLLPVLGRSVTNAIRRNFDELESTRPNKLGGQRQHYYSGARQGTSFVVDGDSALVGIHQVGMGLRYFGGTVRAGAGISSFTGQPTKYLTIPVTAEAYGHRASDFPDLTVLWGRDGPYALGRVTPRTVATAGDTRQTEVLFVLKTQVTVEADPTMLPSAQALSDALNSDFNKYVNMLWRREARLNG